MKLLGKGMLLGLAVLLACSTPVLAQGWGTIKGQVVWGGADVPARAQLKVDKDQQACLAKGALLSEDYVIDAKTKGVRWVMVWLTDPNDPKKALPIHDSVQKAAESVDLDQPCCMFEPHILGMRAGQKLIAKNTAGIAHNVKIDSAGANPNLNQLIPAGGKLPIEGWVAAPTPSVVSCSIHTWMKMYIRVFDHPYYAVTDDQGNFEIKNAPAGNWNLVVWQETKGWVVMQPGKPGKLGIPITVQANAVTNLGQYKLTPD